MRKYFTPSFWAILLVRIYQKTISPMIGPCCRFTPSCSQYYILAVQKYGFIRGSLKGIWRILRCNPFCKGGEDPP
ncbi:MAG: membrane protein insertion efficiency factor YidD [Planctomycetia bacterium]|nr:membrane protein insertion efficiency factor YidD [Planctomycetia bacterium]